MSLSRSTCRVSADTWRGSHTPSHTISTRLASKGTPDLFPRHGEVLPQECIFRLGSLARLVRSRIHGGEQRLLQGVERPRGSCALLVGLRLHACARLRTAQDKAACEKC